MSADDLYLQSRDRLQVNGCIHILDAPFGDTFRLEQSWNFRNEGQDKCRVNMRCGLMVVQILDFQPYSECS